MSISVLGRCLVFSGALVLAACGGSGGKASGGDPDDNLPPPPSLETTNAQLYNGMGFAPAQIPEQDLGPDLGEAVGPGYLTLAGLVAISNLRLSLQPFNWLIPALINNEPEASEPEAGVCTRNNTIISHEDTNEDGRLALGEIVRFRLGECLPSRGIRALSSVEDQLFQGDSSSQISRYLIGGVHMDGYDGLQFSSDNWLMREYDADKRECAREDEEPRDCEQMRFVNQAPGPDGETLAQLTIEQLNSVDPVRLHIWSEGEAATAGEIHSLVNQKDRAALYRISGLDMHLESGDAQRGGTYKLETLDEGMGICHVSTTFVSANYHLCAGGFRVTVPDGRTYSYRAAAGADPTSVYVSVNDGTGAEIDLGALPQSFLMQRLRLSEP